MPHRSRTSALADKFALFGPLSRRASRWPALSVVALLCLGSLVIGSLILVAAQSQDRLIADRAADLARAVLNERQVELGRVARDYAWWTTPTRIWPSRPMPRGLRPISAPT